MFEKQRTRSCSAVCTSYRFFSADHSCRTTCLRMWPRLRCSLRDSRVSRVGPVGSTRVFGMALAVALTVLVAVLPAGLASKGGDPVLQQPSESNTPSVQTCRANASITVKIPEQGSSAQFACDTGFVLYPKEDNQVFSKDCRTKETLSDMTRTQTSPTGRVAGARNQTSPTYTLKAEKQPSKKTLCYLCAKQEITEKLTGTAKDYCTIYVESGARTQFNSIFTFTLALPCVLAASQFA